MPSPGYDVSRVARGPLLLPLSSRCPRQIVMNHTDHATVPKSDRDKPRYDFRGVDMRVRLPSWHSVSCYRQARSANGPASR